MKKTIFYSLLCLTLGLGACKKDRECKCTVTTTYPDGSTNTDLDQRSTYIEIRKSDAKSRCQDFENVRVNENGGTTTAKGECELN
jgi:hypothetical protein